jgi:hypothetical protein
VTTPDRRTPSSHVVAASALFVISGFAALVYQVLWVRELRLLFGSTAESAAVAIAIFFAGLASGGWFWGRRSARTASPLRRFGLLEIGVAVTAFGHFAVVGAYHRLYPTAHELIGTHPTADLALKALVAATLLFPPAFLMGGTLPTMGQHLVALRGGSPRPAPRSTRSTPPVRPPVRSPPASCCRRCSGSAAPTSTAIASRSDRRGARRAPRGAPHRTRAGATRRHRHAGLHGSGRPRAHLPDRGRLGRRARLGDGRPRGRGGVDTAVRAGAAELGVHLLDRADDVPRRAGVRCRGREPARPTAAPTRRSCSPPARRCRARRRRLAVALPPADRRGRRISATIGGGRPTWRRSPSSPSSRWGSRHSRSAPCSPTCCGCSTTSTARRARSSGDSSPPTPIGAIAGALAGGFVVLPLLGPWRGLALLAALYPATAADRARDTSERTGQESTRLVPTAACAGARGRRPRDAPRRARGLRRAATRRTPRRVGPGPQANVAVVVDGDDELAIRVNTTYTLGGTRGLHAERDQAMLPLLVHPDPGRSSSSAWAPDSPPARRCHVPVERLVVCELIGDVVELSRAHFGPWTNGLFDDPA